VWICVNDVTVPRPDYFPLLSLSALHLHREEHCEVITGPKFLLELVNILKHRRKHQRGDVRRSIWKLFCRAPYSAVLLWLWCFMTFFAGYAVWCCFDEQRNCITTAVNPSNEKNTILTLEVRSGCHSSCWRINKNKSAIDSSCETTLRDLNTNTYMHTHTETQRTNGRHARRFTTFK